ncbi:unnamed protein product [Heterosigma akashiwo]
MTAGISKDKLAEEIDKVERHIDRPLALARGLRPA